MSVNNIQRKIFYQSHKKLEQQIFSLDFPKIIYSCYRKSPSPSVISKFRFFSPCLSIGSSKLKDIIMAKFNLQDITLNQREATSFSLQLYPVIVLANLGSIARNSDSILTFLLELAWAGQRESILCYHCFWSSPLVPVYPRRVSW